MRRNTSRILSAFVTITMSAGFSYFGCTKDQTSEEDVQVTPSEESVAINDADMSAQEGEQAAPANTTADVAPPPESPVEEQAPPPATESLDHPIGALDTNEETVAQESPAAEEAPVQESNSSFAQVIDDVNNEQDSKPADMPASDSDNTVGNSIEPSSLAMETPKAKKHHEPKMGHKKEFASPAGSESLTPTDGNKNVYVVQPGDSLSKIASTIYGDLSKWKKLAELNSLSNPNRLYPGDKIQYENTNSTRQFSDEYSSMKRENVTVQRGDSLYTLAARIYGTGDAWKVLWAYNEHLVSDPNRIHVGTKLTYIASAEASNTH